jgi:hypothetical protein
MILQFPVQTCTKLILSSLYFVVCQVQMLATRISNLFLSSQICSYSCEVLMIKYIVLFLWGASCCVMYIIALLNIHLQSQLRVFIDVFFTISLTTLYLVTHLQRSLEIL